MQSHDDLKIKLSDEQKEIIRKQIDFLKIRLGQWKTERKKAYEARKGCAVKHFQGITARIKYAEKQVAYYEQKIIEFELTLERGYI